MTDLIQVEVAYALPLKQTVLMVKLAQGATVEQAINESGLLRRHPELSLLDLKVGIYARSVSLTQPLQGGERIEIYRPLKADPRELRRKRAEQAKAS